MADLGEPVTTEQGLKRAGRALSPVDLLMQVEVPVIVSLGRTRMRMKDLLGLSHGSVVELDEHLGDEVEVRVNNCVIAYGELVAVDGNYGVRIGRTVSGEAAPEMIEAPGETPTAEETEEP